MTIYIIVLLCRLSYFPFTIANWHSHLQG